MYWAIPDRTAEAGLKISRKDTILGPKFPYSLPDNNTSDRHRLAELARRKAHTLAMGGPGHDPNRDTIKAAS
ncbi:MAG: hypothetical protein EAZ91_03945 [Cytophagales bacterium]|nr:MAG: hypothetical protein EAZ91_03945 [Cytophagales bacterium]